MIASYIITHRSDKGHRDRNLSLVLDWLMPLGFEVIVVEQDSEPHVQEQVELKGANYIFAFNDGIFNKSWAVNIGINAANEDLIFCGDNDMILPLEALQKAIDLLKSGIESVKPFTRLIDLTRFQTLLYSVSRFFASFPFRRRQFACFCSGIVAFTRKCLKDIGGWDERFRGWGAEDDAVSVKLKKLDKKTVVLPYTCHHLYHSRTKFDKNKHENYENNLKLLKELESTDDLKELAQPTTTQGDIKKYKKT